MSRMRLSFVAGMAVLLSACASGPTPPAWQANAKTSLDAYIEAWLRGETRLANAAFARARGELASTGQAEQVAVAELTRCALDVASVAAAEGDSCPGFAPLAADAGERSRAYAAFLTGRAVDSSLLPAQYGAFSGAASLSRIEAPLPRLIAAGVLLRRNALPPEGVALAVETASAQGWRRPLLAWLGVQARVASASGDVALAAQARRRAALLGGIHGNSAAPPDSP
ncbi:MAG: hypothetical protein KGL40_10110 [Rhodocyclaceae bacterium]|nr:hypothetical protein [Rhodocyclaceae bacterium]